MGEFDLREKLPSLNNSAAAIAAGMRIGELEAFKVQEIAGVPYVLAPRGMALQSMNHLAPVPHRLQFDRTFAEPESFCQFAKEMDAKSGGRLYGDLAATRIWALFADVAADRASWEDRKAKLELKASPELSAWINAQKKPMSQLEFVEFLEEMIHTIQTPSGADIAAAYRAFQASQNVKVTQVVNEGGDLQVAIEEEVRGQVKSSTASVPARLILALRIFNMGKMYNLEVMVTYRFKDNALVFFVKLLRLSELIEQAFTDVREEVETALGMKVLF